MISIEKVKERIRRVIQNEREATERERDEFRTKKHDEESYWGCGGNYRRYEACEEKREKHLKELRQLENSFEAFRPTEELKLWPFYCPSCQVTTYLSSNASRQRRDIIDCPLCNRTLYRAADHVTWEVIAGSRRTKT